jgi:poly-gamma-glutamate synthesis protein (capsule biosynthesis protein)
MRAYNLWREPYANLHEPGVAPLCCTVPDEGDWNALRADIEAARAIADVIVCSFHWGDFRRRYDLTDHELRTARHSIDCGADVVVGHHHHVLRGMEWYKGRPIFYGLGHFVFDVRVSWSEEEYKTKVAESGTVGYSDHDFAPGYREGWPLLPMHPDARLTVLAWVSVDSQCISEFGFVPCRLQPDGTVMPVDPREAEGNEVVRYLEKCNTTQRLNGQVVLDRSKQLAGMHTCVVLPGPAETTSRSD